ncbi:DUF6950 family protein [Kaistia algarum]|uniref:DUF6950 family protein n=1 Tax=Kaistia algarum TaxID=2083279 RepID=UPI002255013F|nr:hypothetical protein [Kaistia algarum]MCX5513415.1 hypothetical protein [Kaistia algarum]
MKLQGFLTEYGARPWVWGEVDCCLVMADWLIENGYQDCAAHLRGTYRTEADLNTILDAAGGVLPIVKACFALIPLELSSTPDAGSVGVIGDRSNIHRQWGAIFDGVRWQVRLKGGMVQFSAPLLACWRI